MRGLIPKSGLSPIAVGAGSRCAVRDKKSTTPRPSFTRRGIIGPTNHVPPPAFRRLPTAFSRYARYSFIMLI
jgi:hypothetical protein